MRDWRGSRHHATPQTPMSAAHRQLRAPAPRASGRTKQRHATWIGLTTLPPIYRLATNPGKQKLNQGAVMWELVTAFDPLRTLAFTSSVLFDAQSPRLGENRHQPIPRREEMRKQVGPGRTRPADQPSRSR